ncbi:MAG: NAD(P)-binding domain-containing protein [Gemmataceae bacterium]
MARASPNVAILGAGPIGLEAALAAKASGLSVTVYERGRIGEHLHRWGHVKLFTPFGWNVTSLGRSTLLAENPKQALPAVGDHITGREHVAAYLEPLAMSATLIDSIRTETTVIAVGRRGLLKHDTSARTGRPFRIIVRDAKGERAVEADAILDCTGTYGQPRWLGEAGLPAAGESAIRSQIAYTLDDIVGADRAKYAGKSVLVVGAGFSAATTVCALADLAVRHADMWTVWLARGPRSQPLPRDPNDVLRERDRLAARANSLATRGEGNIEFHANSSVETVVSHGPDKGFRVTARVGSANRSWDVDRIVGNVGYQPDPSLVRELQVAECPRTQRPTSHEPGYYVLGSKSFGRDNSVLLRDTFSQVARVVAEIASRK